jgi:multiple sugar transport system permease protein
MSSTTATMSEYVNVDANVDVAQSRRINRRPMSSAEKREAITGYLFILPALIGFIVFVVYPAGNALWIALNEWDLQSPKVYVGLQNFRELWHDPLFWNAAKVTFFYALMNIPLQMVLGLFLATAMSRAVRSFAIRGTLILPYLLSNVIAAMVWLWVFDPQLGFANQLFGWLHLPQMSFLGDPAQALASIAAVNIWRHMGFTALLFYAGMQSIPGALYEAARIDGASEMQMFRRITLPLLRPVGAFVFITSLVGSFQIYDTVAVATKPIGGPIDTTRTLVVYINTKAFGQYEMGYATSMAVVLFAFLICLSLVQMRLFRGDQSDLG